MKIVKVTYTVRVEYSDHNQRNIEQVMSDLRGLNNENIRYTALVSSDSTTFTHIAFFKSEQDQAILNGIQSFRDFQEQLKASGLVAPPVQEILTLVGSSMDMFPS